MYSFKNCKFYSKIGKDCSGLFEVGYCFNHFLIEDIDNPDKPHRTLSDSDPCILFDLSSDKKCSRDAIHH